MNRSTANFFEQASAQLEAQLAQARFTPDRLVRLSASVPAVNLIAWLKSNPLGPRYYWRNRNHTLALAAVGDCMVIEHTDTSQRAALMARLLGVVAGTDAGFIGGQSFNSQNGTGQWQDYPGFRYSLPMIELRQIHETNTLFVNLLANDINQWQTQLAQASKLLKLLRFAELQPLMLPEHSITRRTNSVDKPAWDDLVAEALDQISQLQVRKVVLARQVNLTTQDPIDAFDLLAAWQTLTPNSFSFLFHFDGGVFLGCSPERLLSRRHRAISTESLAGTTRRGATPEEDFQLGQLLLHDPKLCHEHELVSQFVTERIAPFVTELQIKDRADVFKLDRIQHRYLPIKGQLKPGVQDAELLQQLHPTPAVGGLPQDKALTHIHSHEPFDRGWYSGVVGVASEQNADYVVAIRSALVKDNHLQCFSGVGLVEGSIADAEWQELEAKIESLLTALTGNCP